MQEWVEGHVTECPVQWIDGFAVVFRAVNYFDKGILPSAGGWAEQPANLMLFVEQVLAERGAINGRKATDPN